MGLQLGWFSSWGGSLSMTESATLTFAELTAETLLHQIVQTVTKGDQFHLVNDLVDEGKLQQQLGFLHGDTALLHIEQGCIVELAYGGTMGTLHVIGIDFKHGLCEHPRRLRSAKILVGHLRGRLLGIMGHKDLSGKSSDGFSIEHVFVEFLTGAMGHTMGNQRIVIYMLPLVGYHTTVARTFFA